MHVDAQNKTFSGSQRFQGEFYFYYFYFSGVHPLAREV